MCEVGMPPFITLSIMQRDVSSWIVEFVSKTVTLLDSGIIRESPELNGLGNGFGWVGNGREFTHTTSQAANVTHTQRPNEQLKDHLCFLISL